MSRLATIVIDMLNPYDHEDADALAKQAESRIETIAKLIRTTQDSDAELIYANDNFDDFTATSKDLGENAMKGERPDLVEPILPPKGALFVQKVRHSAFYSSSLDHLLKIEEIETVILAGQVTEQCILYSALDAYVRGYNLRIAQDAVIPIDPDLGDAALKMMETNMSAEIVSAEEALG
jgi:nicotinamidase-related amidase